MRPRKFGGLHCLRNSVTRRHLFYNQNKALSLDEVLEYSNCRCIDKRWEVSKISLNETTFQIEREKIFSTPYYIMAWNMVKDENFGKERVR